jgi:hypothetical protein
MEMAEGERAVSEAEHPSPGEGVETDDSSAFPPIAPAADVEPERIAPVPDEGSGPVIGALEERPEAQVVPEEVQAADGAESGKEYAGDLGVAEPAAGAATADEQTGAPARPEMQPPAGIQPAAEAVGDLRATEPPASLATPAPAGNAASAAAPSPEIAAMLDEAELYLLPQWADYAEVARILDRVAALAPREPRLLALRGQLEAAQRGGPNIDGLLREAQQRLDAGDHWGAVDLYEQALSQKPGDERAGRGLERARLLARWTARLAGAANDAPRLQQLGAEYAENAPELAARAFAEAFAVEATILSLRGWLMALAASEGWTEIGRIARQGLAELRQHERVSAGPAPDATVEAIESAASARSRQDAEAAIAAFAQALVANARRPREPDRNDIA